MASIRELRNKIKSVKSTQQITKAMKLVAAARLNKAQERIMQARPFADRMERLLGELAFLAREAGEVPGFNYAFFKPREGERIDLVLVTADRGLCGGFNANLIRRGVQFLRENPGKDIRVWCVGKKGRDFFRRFYQKIERENVNIFQRLSFAQAEVLSDELMEAFLKTDTTEVVVLYNEFKSRLQQKITLRRLLPFAAAGDAAPEQDFIYEPSRVELLKELLPRYVKAQMYRILLESQSAELAARMAAMDSATNNAKDLIASLSLTMNKVRQASITRELAEIVSGAEALQG